MGRWSCSHLMALFKGLGSRHTRSFPFGFLTTTNPLTQAVAFWTVSMISKSSIRFYSFSNFGFKARGIFLRRVPTGVPLSLISIWWVFLRVPISSNQKTPAKIVHHLLLRQKYVLSGLYLSQVDNPRIGTDSESTTTNETSNDISYALE